MKHIVKIMIVLLLLLTVTGCGNDGNVANRVGNGNNVDKVISEQIDKTESENNSSDSEKDASTKPEGGSEERDCISEKSGNDSVIIDYDLTNMSSDMVYAIVYQMMVDPDAYIGKTFRMEGMYYAVYYEPTGKYYHYCIIQDALACCAQGMEFVWGDGSHVYPDEYPKENTKIVVQGTFETYREDGDDNLYCRLKDATMEVINE
mgnify:FL=1|jgi:hypothetical protein